MSSGPDNTIRIPSWDVVAIATREHRKSWCFLFRLDRSLTCYWQRQSTFQQGVGKCLAPACRTGRTAWPEPVSAQPSPHPEAPLAPRRHSLGPGTWQDITEPSVAKHIAGEACQRTNSPCRYLPRPNQGRRGLLCCCLGGVAETAMHLSTLAGRSCQAPKVSKDLPFSWCNLEFLVQSSALD